ncbi:MAG: epoxyqueuosine reductase QueH [Oscillospiraceae bacterium]|nr:epoxyqueuosine reductase QueH [Oscillospiraceae bacterium]
MTTKSYQKKLDEIIREQGEHRPKLLLHSCCGPCSSAVLEALVKHFEVTLLWYNPNLYPESEFRKRLDTLKELLEKSGLDGTVGLRVEDWAQEDFAEKVRGLENEPEGGRRCEQCFRLRLLKTAEIAAREGFDYFCTTLTVSRFKNAELINRIGEEAAGSFNAAWLPSDFKKRGGEERSQVLSRQYGLYRQNYCGCQYSLWSRENTG